MTNSINTTAYLQREPSWHTSGEDVDHARGRTRNRTLSRANVDKSVHPDESSTLRGRSRRRAASPAGLASRAVSPSVGNILHYRLKKSSRREHCPSRPASSSSTRRQNSPRRRQQRTRSRSRSATQAVVESMLLESLQHQQSSSLRNEVLIQEEAVAQEERAAERRS